VVREVITILAMAVAIGVTSITLVRNNRAQVVIEQLAPKAARLQTLDRLVGSRIDLARLVGEDNPSPQRPILVWVIDLERCDGCFDDIGQWVRLERLSDYDLFLLLSGMSEPGVEAQLRGLTRTLVKEVGIEDVLGVLGGVLPNTKLVLSPQGVVMMVDSRASGQICGWNFEAQVGALLGVNTPEAIRGLMPEESHP